MTEAFKGEVILYQTEDGRSRLHLREAEGTVWLTQSEMAELFDNTKQNMSLHLKNIFDDKELNENSVVKESLTTASDGKNYSTKYYNLDAILAVGYRVRSPRGTQFRKWATTILSEYLIKGFALDEKKLKDPKASDYFDELLEKIRDIRASQKRFYQKVRDIFAMTSVDYDKNSEAARTFFKTIQNKLVYAVTGRTAAELIVERADPEKPNMNLMTWQSTRVRKSDTTISNNYLTLHEIELLGLLTTMFLDFADLRARDRQAITMEEWIQQTDAFLTFNRKEILKTPGTISHEHMEKMIHERYALFEEKRQAAEKIEVEREHEKEMAELIEEAKKIKSPNTQSDKGRKRKEERGIIGREKKRKK